MPSPLPTPTSPNSGDTEFLDATLQAVLELSDQGFLTFGSDFAVDRRTSANCKQLLGLDPVGKPVDLVLWAHESQREDFLHGLTLVFTGKTDPDVIFDLLESETTVEARTLQLRYRLLTPQKVLVSLTDVSAQKKIAELGKADDDRRNLLLKTVSHRIAFGAFTREFSQLFTLLADLGSTLGSVEKTKELALNLHTMKGNAGFFEFHKTATAAHQFEQHLADNAALGAHPQLKPYTLALKKAYYEELGSITSFLGERWLKEIDSVAVPLDSYLKLEAWFRQKHPEEKAMIGLLQRFRTVPFRDLFLRFPDMSLSLARQLGKELHPVTVEGGDFPVLPDQFEALVSSLVHLVRNQVDHGIEAPEEREAAGKDRRGLLQIRISREADALFMVFSDDGQGIDLSKVEAKARSLGVLPDFKSVSPEALLDLLFLAGFSTAETVTEISGRGVGLSAVKDAITRLGGTITAHTRSGRGTSFDIMLPVQGDHS
ncbi:MAG: ATP-binding protein [Spirochaetales bacterium]